MNTTILAHRFFHEPDKRGEYANVKTSFEYYTTRSGQLVWRYYSYSTCIGEIRRNKKGKLCLLVSEELYSKCTSKHISELVRACPFGMENILRVPRVGDGFFYGDYRYLKGTYDFERALKNIADMPEEDLRRKENRNYVSRFIRLYDIYTATFGDTTKQEKRLRGSAKVAKAIDITKWKNQALFERSLHVATPEELAKREKQRAKKQARIEKKIAEYIGDGNSLEKLQAVFSGSRYYRGGLHYAYDNVSDAGLREAMNEYRKMLSNQRDSKGRYLSYVWLEGEQAKTSQRCSAPLDDVRRLCILWKRHKDMVGEHAGHYQVVERDDQHVKIGCHVIPAWNIELICNELKITA